VLERALRAAPPPPPPASAAGGSAAAKLQGGRVAAGGAPKPMGVAAVGQKQARGARVLVLLVCGGVGVWWCCFGVCFTFLAC